MAWLELLLSSLMQMETLSQPRLPVQMVPTGSPTKQAPGTYGVEFDLPPDYVFALAPPPLQLEPLLGEVLPSYDFVIAHIMPDTDRDISETVVGTTPAQVVTSGKNNTSFDAGIYIPVIVGGIVWDDLNGNEIMDQSEPHLGGAIINIVDDMWNEQKMVPTL